MDNGLLGADSVDEAVRLKKGLQELFSLGGFKLRKSKSSNGKVSPSIPENLIDPKTTQETLLEKDYTKILGVEWNAVTDCFQPMISLPSLRTPSTKRVLVSDIARVFDALAGALLQ